jgi:hypothetical protein
MRSALATAVAGLVTVGFSGLRYHPSVLAFSGPSPPADRPKATVIRGKGWAIAAPDDWRRFPAVGPPMELYLIGDARKGIPPLDGTLSALKVGLTVEVFPDRGGLSARQRAEKDLDDLKVTTGSEIQGEPEIQEIKLADGTNATRLMVEVAKPRQQRLAFYRNDCHQQVAHRLQRRRKNLEASERRKDELSQSESRQ